MNRSLCSSTDLPQVPLERKLQKTLAMIRKMDSKEVFESDKAFSSDFRIGYLNGESVERLVITLRSTGCAWVRRGGGCTMCGHYPGTTQGVPISPHDYVDQFKTEMTGYLNRPVPVLCLYNSGSVLNEDEIPGEALHGILHEIVKYDAIKKVVFESRPEYCTREKVGWIQDRLGTKTFEVAMGLESSDNRVLNLTLNKGFTAEEFRSNVDEISRFVRFRIYILLKGPFLTEAEAIDDAVASIGFAQSLSPQEVHLEPATLQKHTLLYQLAQAGLYRLPWLWSVTEVLRRVGGKSRVYVSPFNHMPSPLHIPSNCPSCTERVREQLIQHYNRTFDLTPLHRDPCACRDKWKEEMERSDPRPLEERVEQGLDLLRTRILNPMEET